MVGSEANGRYASHVCWVEVVGDRNAISQPQLWVYGRPTLTGVELIDLTTWRGLCQPVQVKVCVQIQQSQVERLGIWTDDVQQCMQWNGSRKDEKRLVILNPRPQTNTNFQSGRSGSDILFIEQCHSQCQLQWFERRTTNSPT